MNILMRFWNWLTGAKSVTLQDRELLEWLGIDAAGNRKAINEATYYTCMKLLCETMGKLPLKFYQQTGRGRIRAEPSDVTRLLTIRPNDYMTPTTMWTTVEFNTQQFGNGYVWMRGIFAPERFGGSYRVTELWPLRSDSCSDRMKSCISKRG